MLFHHYPEGSAHHTANVSKTLLPTQRGYSQIQREALAVIFGVVTVEEVCDIIFQVIVQCIYMDIYILCILF